MFKWRGNPIQLTDLNIFILISSRSETSIILKQILNCPHHFPPNFLGAPKGAEIVSRKESKEAQRFIYSQGRDLNLPILPIEYDNLSVPLC